jgi:hypothetical protein
VHFPAEPQKQSCWRPRKINTASSFMIGELSLINTVVVEPDTDSRWIEAVSRQGISVVTA